MATVENMATVETGFFTNTDGGPKWYEAIGGTSLPKPPRSIKEALEIGGLNWTVHTERLKTEDGKLTNAYAIRRDTDGRVLGNCGAGWHPAQNEKAFEPYQALIDSGLIELVAGGAVRGGERVFLIAKIVGQAAEVVKGDEVRGQFIFYNGHDGKLGCHYTRGGLRMWCYNQIPLALETLVETARSQRNKDSIRLIHRSNVTAKIDKLVTDFRMVGEQFARMMDVCRLLAKKRCPNPMDFFKKVLRVPEPGNGVIVEPVPALEGEKPKKLPEPGKLQLRALEGILETQPGAEAAPGTYWNAFNAVTYWTDHVRGKSDDARLNASLFGDGREIRARAMRIAIDS